MPNPRWNNQHGANDKSGGGAPGFKGSKPSGSMPMKTANWAGLPGKTQSKDRSAGVKKTGHKVSFHVKATGI